MLCNQAHDSICGCSIDPVHERMVARYDDAEGLGRATCSACSNGSRAANVDRDTPWQRRRRRRRLQRVGRPRAPMSCGCRSKVSRRGGRASPASTCIRCRCRRSPGVTVDGQPARLVRERRSRRECASCPESAGSTSSSSRPTFPRSGVARYRLAAGPGHAPDEVDDGREIEAGTSACVADDDGTLSTSRSATSTYHRPVRHRGRDRSRRFLRRRPIRRARLAIVTFGDRRADAARVGYRSACTVTRASSTRSAR